MYRYALLIAMFFALLSVCTAQIDPTNGVISHSYLDRESDVFVGMINVLDRNTREYTAVGFSFLNEYGTLPTNDIVDVYEQTDDTIIFFQSGTMYTAAIVKPLFYTGVLSDSTFRRYEDDSYCYLFHLTITETNDQYTICTEAPDFYDGPVSLLVSYISIDGHFSGAIMQEYTAPYVTTDDSFPVEYRVYLPTVNR